MADTCISLIDTTLDGPVADCNGLAQFDAALAAEVAKSAVMTHGQLDVEVAQILAAMKRRTVAIAKAKEAVTKNSKKLALDAVGATVDLAIETCLFTKNPICIGSAYGVKIMFDAASFGVQMYDTTTAAERAEVVVAFGKGRVGVYKGLIGAMKPTTPAQSAARAVRSAVRVARTLSSAASTVSQAKADLEAAVAELDEMNKLYSEALISPESYRRYRAADFESRRFLIKILSSYAGTGCRVDHLPPLP